VPEVYVRVARQYGLDRSAELLAGRFRHAFAAAPAMAPPPGADAEDYEYSWWKMLAASALDCPPDDLRFVACFDELFHYYAGADAWRIHDALPELLQELQEGGLKLGICSNFDGRLYRIFDALGLSPWFNCIVLPREAGFQKPEAGIFHYLATTLGVEAASVLHVGDDIHEDVVAAEEAGLAAWRWMLPPEADINRAREDLLGALYISRNAR